MCLNLKSNILWFKHTSQHLLMIFQLWVENLRSFWIFALFKKSWILYIKVGWHSQNKNLTQVVPIWETNYQNDSQPFNCLTKGSSQLALRRWICYWKTLFNSYNFAIKSFQFGSKMNKLWTCLGVLKQISFWCNLHKKL